MCAAALLALLAGTAGAGLRPRVAAAEVDPADACQRTIAMTLGRCFTRVSARTHRCLLDAGSTCPDAELAAELERMARRVTSRCSDESLRVLGFGPSSTVAAVVARLDETCRGEALALAARTFGGPHGALLPSASEESRACLATAAQAAAGLARSAFGREGRCARRAARGKVCSNEEVDASLAAESASAAEAVAAQCSDLGLLIGLDTEAYRDRALAQARCLVASAHPDPSPRLLDCGPTAPVAVPPRGQWTRVILDEATWGTRCGDGSAFAFWLRLAPEGAPVERVVIDLQGGGVCTNDAECREVGSGLFRATDNAQPSGGWRSTDPAVNPFWDWTMLALPYCNQDVYTGGGRTNAFPSLTVERFGAVNVQAALRYLRDVLWREMNEGSEEGYRPDRLRVLFGGVSAGGFGVEYNVHYLLDDLRWVNTTAVPDSALGLSNGTLLGVSGLGLLMIGTGPTAWAGLPYHPSYCRGVNCGIVPERLRVTAPRLAATPWQRILNVSNQVDHTQRSTTRFASSAAWTNAVRDSYCRLQGARGIHYFLPAGATSLHGMLQSDSRFTSIRSDGVTLRDWLAAAMSDPGGVVDRVEEGGLATGSVAPFPCAVD